MISFRLHTSPCNLVGTITFGLNYSPPSDQSEFTTQRCFGISLKNAVRLE